MQEVKVTFEFDARYYRLGQLNSATRQLWIALHGYGQLAQYFARKLEPLTHQNICVLVPEGLSRFYLEDVQTRSQGGSQRVGASWMTRENREVEISNYLTYLDTLYRKETSHLADVPPVTVLGFSQGAATATRWAVHQPERINRLILWAGLLPHDLDFERGKDVFRNIRLVHVYGKEDPYVTDSRFIEMKNMAQQLSADPEIIHFDGKHELHESTLLSLT